MAVVNTLNSLGKIILPKENPVELTITNNTITIDPNSGSYFFLDGIDSNLTINISSLSASSKTIYLKLNFNEDNIVISWPNNIKWQEITSPSISQYEDLFISLMTLDGGTTWYSEPVVKTKPLVDCSDYMATKYPSTYISFTEIPLDVRHYLTLIRPYNVSSFFGIKESFFSKSTQAYNSSNISDKVGIFSLKQYLLYDSFDVSTLDVSEVRKMDCFFAGWSSLKSLDTSLLNWDTSKVTSMKFMFATGIVEETGLSTGGTPPMRTVSDLTYLDLSGLDTSNVTDMTCIFSNNYSLTTLDITSIDTSSVELMSGMFSGDFSLETITGISSLNTESATDFSYLFMNCSSLDSLDLSNWDVSNVDAIYGMFYGCSSLTSLKPPVFTGANMHMVNLDDLSDSYGVFGKCSSLTSLDLSSWDTTGVVSMRNLFNGCSSLQVVDLSNFNFESLYELGGQYGSYATRSMFTGCSNLLYIIFNDPVLKEVPVYSGVSSGSGEGNMFSNYSSGFHAQYSNTIYKILVPQSVLSAYQNSSVWGNSGTYANRFDAIENYTITRSNGQVTVTPNS